MLFVERVSEIWSVDRYPDSLQGPRSPPQPLCRTASPRPLNPSFGLDLVSVVAGCAPDRRVSAARRRERSGAHTATTTTRRGRGLVLGVGRNCCRRDNAPGDAPRHRWLCASWLSGARRGFVTPVQAMDRSVTAVLEQPASTPRAAGLALVNRTLKGVASRTMIRRAENASSWTPLRRLPPTNYAASDSHWNLRSIHSALWSVGTSRSQCSIIAYRHGFYDHHGPPDGS